MHGRVTISLLTASLAVAAPAGALYRIDTFAGRGYGDGGPAIAASVIDPADAVTDAAGNVYFSDKGDQLVRRVDTAGTITTVAGTGSPGSAGDGGPAILANLHDPDGLALDAAEQNLYIVENLGLRVRRVDLATGIITTFAGTGEESTSSTDTGDGGPATAAKFNQPVGVAVNADGDVFISERDEDHGDPSAFDLHHPRIRRVDHATGIISLFAGNRPEIDFNGDGHPALETTLADPIGLQFDGAGNLYVGELGNHRVRKIAAAAPHIVSTVAGTGSFNEGSQPFSGDGGPATSAGLDRPVRFALVPRGCGGPGASPCEIYIGDSQHHCVRKVDTSGIITTVVNAPPDANTTPVAGNSGDGGPALAARLIAPAARPGPNGTILVIDDDAGANRVRLYDPAAGTIRAFAGTGEGGFGGDGGPATRALLNRPTGLAVDGAGNVFVTEHNNFRVRRIASDRNRTITTFAGTGEKGGGGDGGPASAAQFGQPTGISITPVGDFLIADALTETVRRIDHASSFIFPFAGTGQAGFGGDGGPATAAQLNTPLRTAVTSAGDVVIADFNNNVIRRVDGSGQITTFASGLSNPAGLVVGSDGLLYVSDFGNERIVTIGPAGTIQQVAGTGAQTGAGADRGDGGPAGAATFSDPTGLSFDVDGSLLVADQGNNVIRRIAPDAGGKISPASIITTIAGDGRPTFGGDGGNALGASLSRPTEALALADGRILIADRGNQRVRIATPVSSLCAASCDDGDPCTVDTCDPTNGCMHQPSPDRDGDGVCDAVDNCPDVPNPNQNPDACQHPSPAPAASCVAGDPTCIPGDGPPGTDCLVETVVAGAHGTPVVRCTDGDPACDADPAAGHCGFTVTWCFNNADPRLRCAARPLTRVAIRVAMKPRSAARSLVSAAIGAVAQAAGGAPRGPSVLFARPLTATNVCTSPMTVDVAVAGRAGHPRPGKALVAVTARTSKRARDADRLRLVCLPAK